MNLNDKKNNIDTQSNSGNKSDASDASDTKPVVDEQTTTTDNEIKEDKEGWVAVGSGLGINE